MSTRKHHTITLCGALAVAALQAVARPVDLSHLPPDMASGADPNVVITFDDSGSMSRGFMPEVLSGTSFSKLGYYSTFNKQFFDPTRRYDPPLEPDGTPFPDADYHSARMDGVCANRPAGGPALCGKQNPPYFTHGVDLANNFAVGARQDHDGLCVPGTGTTAPDNLTHQCGGFYAVYSEARCGASDFDVATGFGAKTGNNWCYDVVLLNNSDEDLQRNFANWFSYYRTRSHAARTVTSRVLAKIEGGVRLTWQTLNADPAGLSSRAIKDFSDPAWRKTFFDWLYATGAEGNTPLREATVAAGEFFRRPLTKDAMDPYWNGLSGAEAGDLSCRRNYNLSISDGSWTASTAAYGVPDVRTPVSAPGGLPPGFTGSAETWTLGDGASTYAPGGSEARIIYNFDGAVEHGACDIGKSNCYPLLADIALHYWGADLQPSLNNKVPTILADVTTGITASSTTLPDEPFSNDEIFWNPANDPATWQHVSQLVVSFGVYGAQRRFPDDLIALRAGSLAWPVPTRYTSTFGQSGGVMSEGAVDDFWHAAVNSRGRYYPAFDAQQLERYLAEAFSQLGSSNGSASSSVPSMPILTADTAGYRTGYDTADWSGTLEKVSILPDGGPGPVQWEAGCLLTGPCAPYGYPRDPDSRLIATSSTDNGQGIPFRWSSLTSAQTAALSTNPVTNASDGRGEQRLAYLRGSRSGEGVPPTMFRKRSSVLGAIVNSQPLYVSSPTGGFADRWPSGSPEAAAHELGHGYAQFVDAHRARAPTIYVGANDGMLHAFDAVDGKERWAYVPDILFRNGRLPRLVDMPTLDVSSVDDSPLAQDAFVHGQWRTVLVQTMRFGGRGAFALDVTQPIADTEAAVAGKAMWEISSDTPGFANLGYTYSSANVARLNNGKWVAVLSSGYFPAKGPDSTLAPALENRTSLFVVDLESGALIREIRTPAGEVSYGLSTPMVYDVEGDQIDDVVVAGDLAGNLWRFDLSDTSSTGWSVERMFKTYDSDTCTPGTSGCEIGYRPISVMPVPLRDPVTLTPVWVFGTGKYLAASDRQPGYPVQAIFGIRDYGKGSANYPIKVNELVDQDLSESAEGVRYLTSNSVAPNKRGWAIWLDTRAGERVAVSATPVYSSNLAVVASVVPTADPCESGHAGALLVVDGGSGTPPGAGGLGLTSPSGGSPEQSAGIFLPSGLPIVGMIPLTLPMGGGLLHVGESLLDIPDTYWHRTAWKDLNP